MINRKVGNFLVKVALAAVCVGGFLAVGHAESADAQRASTEIVRFGNQCGNVIQTDDGNIWTVGGEWAHDGNIRVKVCFDNNGTPDDPTDDIILRKPVRVCE